MTGFKFAPAVLGALSAAMLATGLTVGLAAAAHAEPIDDYVECVKQHPDNIGRETCCVLHDGTWEGTGCIYTSHVSVSDSRLNTDNPGPTVGPKPPVGRGVKDLPAVQSSLS